jgi:hypothetical protein
MKTASYVVGAFLGSSVDGIKACRLHVKPGTDDEALVRVINLFDQFVGRPLPQQN